MLTIIGARGDDSGVPEAGMTKTPKLAIFSGGRMTEYNVEVYDIRHGEA